MKKREDQVDENEKTQKNQLRFFLSSHSRAASAPPVGFKRRPCGERRPAEPQKILLTSRGLLERARPKKKAGKRSLRKKGKKAKCNFFT